jgi:hypothetical protein
LIINGDSVGCYIEAIEGGYGMSLTDGALEMTLLPRLSAPSAHPSSLLALAEIGGPDGPADAEPGSVP